MNLSLVEELLIIDAFLLHELNNDQNNLHYYQLELKSLSLNKFRMVEFFLSLKEYFFYFKKVSDYKDSNLF